MSARCRLLGGLLFLLLAADVAGAPAPGRPAPPAKGVPVTGTCLDETGQPLAGVQVALYRQDAKADKYERIADRETGADGRFTFPDTPALTSDRGLAVVATKAGRGSQVRPLYAASLPHPLEFRLRPAGTLQGRVTDESGKPVAGAHVWAHHLGTGPLEGVLSAVTDKDGKYAIPDMGRWTDEDARPKPIGGGRAIGGARVFFDVRHPDFAHERPTWERIPATVDVVLQPGGVIAGRVTDQVTGKPAAGVPVSLQGIKALPAGARTRTGPDGTYQVRGLKAGQYNLWAEAADRACVAIDSLTVTGGQTLAGQDLALVAGGWIEGRVIDAATGAPLTGTPDRPLYVASYGPGRPKSGAAVQSVVVDADGKFKLRLAPGLNYPYIMTPDLWNRTQGKAAFQGGVEVKDGESTQVEFRVGPK